VTVLALRSTLDHVAGLVPRAVAGPIADQRQVVGVLPAP
jgi:hypothetical protein